MERGWGISDDVTNCCINSPESLPLDPRERTQGVSGAHVTQCPFPSLRGKRGCLHRTAAQAPAVPVKARVGVRGDSSSRGASWALGIGVQARSAARRRGGSAQPVSASAAPRRRGRRPPRRLLAALLRPKRCPAAASPPAGPVFSLLLSALGSAGRRLCWHFPFKATSLQFQVRAVLSILILSIISETDGARPSSDYSSRDCESAEPGSAVACRACGLWGPPARRGITFGRKGRAGEGCARGVKGTSFRAGIKPPGRGV
ncbi:hypothetical protein H8958_019029 [Nasalis larvatus]